MNIEMIYGAQMRLLGRQGMWAYWKGAAAATGKAFRQRRGRYERRALKHMTLGLVEHDRILHGREL